MVLSKEIAPRTHLAPCDLNLIDAEYVAHVKLLNDNYEDLCSLKLSLMYRRYVWNSTQTKFSVSINSTKITTS